MTTQEQAFKPHYKQDALQEIGVHGPQPHCKTPDLGIRAGLQPWLHSTVARTADTPGLRDSLQVLGNRLCHSLN